MTRFTAVCVRCGAFKKAAFAPCRECGFRPNTDYEAARSLILSEKTAIGDLQVGHTVEELREIADSIRRGRPFPIDGELQKQVVRAYYRHMKSQPPPEWPALRLLKWTAILVLIGALAAIAAWWLWLR